MFHNKINHDHLFTLHSKHNYENSLDIFKRHKNKIIRYERYFYLSLKHNKIEIAEFLLSCNDMLLDACNKNLFTTICTDTSLETVQWLYDKIDVNVTGDALVNAACAGNIELVNWLYQLGKHTFNHIEKAFSAACISHNLDTCRLLYNLEPDIDISRISETVLICAYMTNKLELMELLYSISKYMPMHIKEGVLPVLSMSSGHLELSKWTYEHYPEIFYDENNEILSAICKSNSVEMIEWARSIDIYSEDKQMMFHESCNTGAFTLAKYFYNEDISICEGHVNAVMYTGNLDFLKWIVEKRPNLLTLVTFNQLCAKGHINILKWLEEKFPNLHNDCYDFEALKLAYKEGNIDICMWLVNGNLKYLENKDKLIKLFTLESKKSIIMKEWLLEYITPDKGICSLIMTSAIKDDRVNLAYWIHDKFRPEITLEMIENTDNMPILCTCLVLNSDNIKAHILAKLLDKGQVFALQLAKNNKQFVKLFKTLCIHDHLKSAMELHDKDVSLCECIDKDTIAIMYKNKSHRTIMWLYDIGQITKVDLLPLYVTTSVTGDLETTKWLYNNGIVDVKSTFITLLGFGNIDALNWFFEKETIVMGDFISTLTTMITVSNLTVLQWLIERLNLPNIIAKLMLSLSCTMKDLKIIKYLTEHLHIDNFEDYINITITSQNLHISKWFYDTFTGNIKKNSHEIFFTVCQSNDIMAACWLTHIIPEYTYKLVDSNIMPCITLLLRSSRVNEDEFKDEKCQICYEDSEIKTSCRHYFCMSCITRCIIEKNTCPTCRQHYEEIFVSDTYKSINDST